MDATEPTDVTEPTERLRVVIVTVNEYYYIPKFLRRVVEAESIEIVGITTTPPSLGTQNVLAFAYDLFETFGPRVFCKHTAFYAKHFLLDVINRTLNTGASYSCRTLADRYGIEYRHVTDVNSSDYIDYVESKAPDVLVSVAATQKFEPRLLAVPTERAINIHSSLLPEYRGVSPSFWTMLNDEPETGVSVHLMDEDLDSGDVIRQEPIGTRDDDTLHTLNTRVAEVGSEVLLQALVDIDSGSLNRTPIDPEAGSYYSMPSRSDVRAFREGGRRFY
jgi:folate-dependent phosphoribosylglycinamide formyltransferase PurN